MYLIVLNSLKWLSCSRTWLLILSTPVNFEQWWGVLWLNDTVWRTIFFFVCCELPLASLILSSPVLLKETLTHQSPSMLSMPLMSLDSIRGCTVGIWNLYTFAILCVRCHWCLSKQRCRSEHALWITSLSILGKGYFPLATFIFQICLLLQLFAIASHLQDTPIFCTISRVWEKFVCHTSKVLNIQLSRTWLSPIYS